MEKETLEEIKDNIKPEEVNENVQVQVEPKKRKRRKKKEVEPELEMPSVEIPEQIVDLLVRVPFEMASKFTGKSSWELNDFEAQTLAPLYRQLIEKWSPNFAGKYALEMITLSVLATFVGKRYFAADEYSEDEQNQNDLTELDRQHIRDYNGK